MCYRAKRVAASRAHFYGFEWRSQRLPIGFPYYRRSLPRIADDDPSTTEVMSKGLLLARDREIKDPNILDQIRSA